MAAVSVLALASMLVSSCMPAVTIPQIQEPPADPADLAKIAQILTPGGTWTPERAMQFKATYVRLPGKQRFESMRQLASSINTGAIKPSEKQALPF